MFLRQIATVLFLMTDIYFRASVETGPICPLGTLSVIPYQFCYTIGPDALTFDQAAEYCKAKNANLAIFESIAELKLAQNLLPKESESCLEDCAQHWIGLRNSNAETTDWKWINGAPASLTGSIMPMVPNDAAANEQCVSISHGLTKTVYRRDCGQALHFLCKQPIPIV